MNAIQYPSCILPFGEVSDADAGQNFSLREGQMASECKLPLLPEFCAQTPFIFRTNSFSRQF